MLTELQTVFIYALKDPRDRAVKYIGKAIDLRDRFRRHLREAKREQKHTYKNYWVRSLLSAGVSPEMEVLDEVPAGQQNFFERAYIKVYREVGAKLTNLTDGGDGGATTTGRKNTPEQCAKISARLKGVPKTSEHCAALTGKKRTPEQRARMSKGMKGKLRTKEQRARMGASRLGKKRGPYKKKDKNVV